MNEGLDLPSWGLIEPVTMPCLLRQQRYILKSIGERHHHFPSYLLLPGMEVWIELNEPVHWSCHNTIEGTNPLVDQQILHITFNEGTNPLVGQQILHITFNEGTNPLVGQQILHITFNEGTNPLVDQQILHITFNALFKTQQYNKITIHLSYYASNQYQSGWIPFAAKSSFTHFR